MREVNVAVVGASGAVGTQMIKMLEETSMPLGEVKFLASFRSAGKELTFKGETKIIEELVPESFEGVDLALFSAGGGISAKFAPEAVKRGAVVVDNTSHFRMDKEVPLIVPEVNPEALRDHKGIIANPNCSTIQMMVALEPVRQAFGLKRIIVSTYQAVSGAGNQAMEELKNQTQAFLNDEPMTAEILPCGGDKKHYPLAFNALPQIDVFAEEGYTYEEWKMVNETKKIMSDDSIQVSATCVRIPVLSGHSESIYVETEKPATVKEIQEVIANAAGAVVEDDPSQQIYPQALNSVGKKETFVGRIRKDLDVETGVHMWVVSDNLLKGAAWNSVQIAEKMVEMDLL
ncbi:MULTISPECIES: aspartate-semialdehyde dehydrogenase [Enterococcus]|uniref:Aspartate-semialdehyde dehydrogenase n=1 Tax=Candidatus Enterococcus ferrettii TaxID=2815324 RepID=A0ABV0EKV1_9ENTE|nr:aspartate-semialdehyde dehydrogenase [Enterococcus sp. 665A]MBO1341806.1 aspartate-semialdehyde dehydrogenase [Enterococcus sp. 665A]